MKTINIINFIHFRLSPFQNPYIPFLFSGTTEAPATEAPATENPPKEASATEAPATEAPTTDAPATEAQEGGTV